MKFILKKIWWLLLIIAIGAGIYFYWQNKNAAPLFEYTTEQVQRGLLMQTVDSTGTVQPAVSVELNFSAAGAVADVLVKVGDQVNEKDLLIRLDDREAVSQMHQTAANLERAQADLNKIKAGASAPDIRVSERAVDSALTDYQNAQTNLESVQRQVEQDQIANQSAINKAQADLQTANQSQLDIAAVEDQKLKNFYQSAFTALNSSLADAAAALDTTEIMFDGNTAKYHLGVEEPDTLAAEKSTRVLATSSLQTANDNLAAAKLDPTDNAADLALQSTLTALNRTFDNLVAVFNVLIKTMTSADYPESLLNSNKSIVSSQQTAIAGAINSVQTLQQNILNARLSQTTQLNNAQAQVVSAQNALDMAHANADLAAASKNTGILTADSQVKSAKANWEISKAQLELKKAPPRQVDIAAQQASVKQYSAALEMSQKQVADTMLRAPITGIITEINIDKGEHTSILAGKGAAVKMISANGFNIEVDISEADIAKVKPHQLADITFDAFGEEQKFSGQVASINPAPTVIQDVIYYTVKISFDAKEHGIKPGMTANITIHTAQKDNTLFIPRRAIFDKGGLKMVKVLENGQPIEIEVETGLRGDNGMIEITYGLQESQAVVTFTKEL